MHNYNPKEIEPKWQKYWEENKLFKTPKDVTSKNKEYVLPQLPYPSGAGLHVGHAEVYTACDIYARYQRMMGKKVLQVIGWDSFGLPAENYAIKTNVHPKKSTDDAIENFRKQIKSLGISVDWDREVGAHNSDYYKFTQWFFLLMYKRGLAYRKKQAVNWCESCKTVLANEQVVDGKCERCDTVVIQKDMEQWYLRITDYADKLLEGLEKIDWPEETKKRQRDWIGRSEGAEIEFRIQNSEFRINVFTTRPDTLFGATYMVLAPESELVGNLESRILNLKEVKKYVKATKKKTELERQTQKEKTGVELKGVKAINPANGEYIPVWISDFVLASYGTGAVFADAHDERDFEFAKKYNIPLRVTIRPDNDELWKQVKNLEVCYAGDGVHIESKFLDGSRVNEAVSKMIDWLEEKGFGKRKIQYKLRDWSVSRQRFWGAPIPMLYDEKGELQPVPEKDLPVLLPDDVDFKPTGQSPLTYSEDFQKGVEKKYGKGWKREVDTLDTFMCSSWYYYRYLDPKNEEEFASRDKIELWMGAKKDATAPAEAGGVGGVDFYLGGEEHVNGHLLYSRFFTKVLHDAGYINFDEPFAKHRHQGLILGEDNKKMSKRWGNSINPTDVVNEFGADTCRMYEMFMGPLEEAKPWNTNGVKGVRRFLDRVWRLFIDEETGEFRSVVSDEKLSADQERLLHKTIKKVGEDTATLGFNTAIAMMMEFVNAAYKWETIPREVVKTLTLLLSPYAPHMTEELWEKLGNKDSISLATWPKYEKSKLLTDTITLVVQVNGKVRDNIEVKANASEESIKKQALESEKVQKWLEGEGPKKVIYIKGKLVSIVI